MLNINLKEMNRACLMSLLLIMHSCLSIRVINWGLHNDVHTPGTHKLD